MKSKVSIRLKGAILDPQGKTVLQALHQLGYSEVKSVRVGKLIELDIDTDNPETSKKRVEEMSRKLLTNPLMEDFDIETESDDNT